MDARTHARFWGGGGLTVLGRSELATVLYGTALYCTAVSRRAHAALWGTGRALLSQLHLRIQDLYHGGATIQQVTSAHEQYHSIEHTTHSLQSAAHRVVTCPAQFNLVLAVASRADSRALELSAVASALHPEL